MHRSAIHLRSPRHSGVGSVPSCTTHRRSEEYTARSYFPDAEHLGKTLLCQRELVGADSVVNMSNPRPPLH